MQLLPIAFPSLSDTTSAPGSIHSYDDDDGEEEKEGRTFFQGEVFPTDADNFCVPYT